jgi:hypothetical protein
MKPLLAFFFLAFIVLALVGSCVAGSIGVINLTTDVASGALPLVASALLAVYEVVVRLVPTAGNLSIVHAVVSFLQFLSGKLNVTKD